MEDIPTKIDNSLEAVFEAAQPYERSPCAKEISSPSLKHEELEGLGEHPYSAIALGSMLFAAGSPTAAAFEVSLWLDRVLDQERDKPDSEKLPPWLKLRALLAISQFLKVGTHDFLLPEIYEQIMNELDRIIYDSPSLEPLDVWMAQCDRYPESSGGPLLIELTDAERPSYEAIRRRDAVASLMFAYADTLNNLASYRASAGDLSYRTLEHVTILQELPVSCFRAVAEHEKAEAEFAHTFAHVKARYASNLINDPGAASAVRAALDDAQAALERSAQIYERIAQQERESLRNDLTAAVRSGYSAATRLAAIRAQLAMIAETRRRL